MKSWKGKPSIPFLGNFDDEWEEIETFHPGENGVTTTYWGESAEAVHERTTRKKGADTCELVVEKR